MPRCSQGSASYVTLQRRSSAGAALRRSQAPTEQQAGQPLLLPERVGGDSRRSGLPPPWGARSSHVACRHGARLLGALRARGLRSVPLSACERRHTERRAGPKPSRAQDRLGVDRPPAAPWAERRRLSQAVRAGGSPRERVEQGRIVSRSKGDHLAGDLRSRLGLAPSSSGQLPTLAYRGLAGGPGGLSATQTNADRRRRGVRTRRRALWRKPRGARRVRSPPC
eukprot:scaffold865_cov312-Prasinococcus_capsulatus_cf.AAC.14